MIMKDYKTSVLVCTPGYALAIAKTLKKMGIHPKDLRLKTGLFGAEPWSEKMRGFIETGLNITSFDTYGLSEVMGPGVSGECQEKSGLHINEDHFIVEVIDPVTLEPLPEGHEGELVITTITKEGCPLFRYRTGDLTSLDASPCKCGRTSLRMSRVMKRIDDMIIFKGIKVFPSQIEEILAKAERVEPRFKIILDNPDGGDTMEIQVELPEGFNFDEIRHLVEIKTRIAEMLEHELGLTARITLVEQMELMSGTGPKTVRVEDKRA
jgi:phenylacetate-CoA ligase